MKLKRWQETIVERVRKNKYMILQADTGLGKGFVGSYILATFKGTHIVVCPPHLIKDWEGKVLTWDPTAKIHILDKHNKKMKVNHVNLLSYNKLIRYMKSISKSKPKNLGVVVLDESHYIKQFKINSSATFRAVRELMLYKVLANGKVRYKNAFNYSMFMSATLITKSTADLFSPMWFAREEFRETNPTWYTPYKAGKFITKEVRTPAGTIDVIVGVKPKVLEREYYPYIDNITFKSAGVQEPEKVIQEIEWTPSKTMLKEIKSIQGLKKLKKEDIIAALEGLSAPQVQEFENMLQNSFAKLFQLLNGFVYKLDKDGNRLDKNFSKNKLEMVNSIIISESGGGSKGLLLYFFKSELKYLKQELKGKVYYHTKGRDVEEQIREFESGDFDIFVANIKSIGEGIRFKNTDYLIEHTLHYDYGSQIQGRGRLRYVGRPTPYKIYSLYPSNIELLEDLKENIENKQKQIQSLKDNDSSAGSDVEKFKLTKDFL